MSSATIVVHEDAQENAMANMVAELLQANLYASRYKRFIFSLMKGVVMLEAVDAEVRATLFFDKGRCEVYDGMHETPDLRIFTDSESILELSLIRVVGGLPFYFDAAGRGVGKKLVTGDVCIGGMLVHPLLLTQLTIVLSVN